MGPKDNIPQDEPQKLSFWGKTKLAVSSFIRGAVRSIPTTLIYTAVAFTASAVIGQAFGVNYDFLKTGVSTLGELATRMLGASVIGGVISGTVSSFNDVRAASKAEEAAPPAGRAPTGERTRGQASYYDVSPAMTPAGHKFPERVGIQH